MPGHIDPPVHQDKGKRTRKRKLPARYHVAKRTTLNSVDPPLHYDMSGKQVTVSEGHPWRQLSRKGGPSQDIGGDFYSSRSFVIGEGNFSMVNLRAPFPDIPRLVSSYEGPLTAPAWDIGIGSESSPLVPRFPPTLELTDLEMDELGARLVEQAKPGQPIANVSTALGELLKDGLPVVPGFELLRSGFRRTVGSSEYLNYQFGVQPLLSDAKKFLDGIRNSSAYIKQLKRDNGKVVRRKLHLPSETSSSVIVPPFTPSGPSPSDSIDSSIRDKYGFSGGQATATRDVSRQQWFSGAFTYYLPDDFGKGMHGLSDKLDAVFGTEMTLDSLWNLAPWSWAVDWFSSTGATISNAEDILSHGLVMHYGYVMVTTTVTDTYTFRYSGDPSGRPKVSDVILVTQTKQRRRANPFGFGANWEDLSPFQLSIAAALGINRT